MTLALIISSDSYLLHKGYQHYHVKQSDTVNVTGCGSLHRTLTLVLLWYPKPTPKPRFLLKPCVIKTYTLPTIIGGFKTRPNVCSVEMNLTNGVMT